MLPQQSSASKATPKVQQFAKRSKNLPLNLSGYLLNPLFSIAAPFSGLDHASIGAWMTCFGSHGGVNSHVFIGHLFSSWSKNVNDLLHVVALLGLMHLCFGSGIPLLIATGCSDGKALAGKNHHGVCEGPRKERKVTGESAMITILLYIMRRRRRMMMRRNKTTQGIAANGFISGRDHWGS